VLDFDDQDGARRVLGMTPRELACHTLVSATARGHQVYARIAEGRARSRRADGCDVLGEGALVVAPPSVHPSGEEYVFLPGTRLIGALESFAEADPLLNANARPAAATAPPRGGARGGDELDWDTIEAWIAAQAPKLVEAWNALATLQPASSNAWRADYAVARCLWEGGWSARDAARVLLALPGSAAAVHGEEYALRTAVRAARGRRKAIDPSMTR
jgi:hypothetical protein